VVFEDVIIKDDEEPPLVSNETSSQNTGRDSNSNSSSTTLTRNRRRNTVEGTMIAIKDFFLQRQSLSRKIGYYYLNDIGGEGSFVYVIDTGLNKDHGVSNFFRFFFSF
jgi:hypothetical protein